jgi:hypothetical protein
MELIRGYLHINLLDGDADAFIAHGFELCSPFYYRLGIRINMLWAPPVVGIIAWTRRVLVVAKVMKVSRQVWTIISSDFLFCAGKLYYVTITCIRWLYEKSDPPRLVQH